VRLALDGEKVVEEEHLLHALSERIRDVRQGPDGALWPLTDNSAGRILRLVPRGTLAIDPCTKAAIVQHIAPVLGRLHYHCCRI